MQVASNLVEAGPNEREPNLPCCSDLCSGANLDAYLHRGLLRFHHTRIYAG